MGLLDEHDWQAVWVAPEEDSRAEPGDRPAPLLRAEFDVAGSIAAARIHLTAHGVYEAFLNGERIGADELAPGFTQYDAHVAVQTYDVTDHLRPGRNAIGVILADGWFRGQIGITRAADQWGTELALLAQLEITHADGTRTVFGTGPHWRSGSGHVVAADLIAGERWDLTRLPRGWSDPGFDDADWTPVIVRDHGFANLVDSPAPPVRRVQELTPVSVTRLDDARSAGRPRAEHQRLDPADQPRTGRHDHPAGARRVARRRRRPDHRTSPPGRAVPPGTVAGGPGRRSHVGRDRGRGLRAAADDARLPVRPHRGPSRRPDAGRRHRGRGAHRHAADRLVLLQRRTDQSPARGRGLELPRTTPATSRPTARTASGRAGSATGSSTSPPPPTCTTSPVSRPSGCGIWPPTSGRTAASRTSARPPAAKGGEPDRPAQRLGRLGGRRRHRAVGALPGVRRHPDPGRSVADDGGLDGQGGADRAQRSAPVPGGPSARAGAVRAVSPRHRLPLGRMARPG